MRSLHLPPPRSARGLAIIAAALFALVLACALAGCGSMATVTSANDRTAVNSQAIQSGTREVTRLAQTNVITKEQAATGLKTSEAASAALTTYEDMRKAGNTAGAAAQLTLATDLLTSLRKFITTNGGTAP